MFGERRFVSPDSHYAALERAHPRAVIDWACATIDRLAIATSFQSSGLVILHIARSFRPDIPILFLDTGFHFPETLDFKREMTELWDLKVVDLRGAHGSPEKQARECGPHLYARDPDLCCHINKVEPLQLALEEFDGWISGLRRDQSPLRAQTPIVEAQLLSSGNEILKLHPLAAWSAADVHRYVKRHDIPTHPLLEHGFASIGCQPCTRALAAGEGERAGRWAGFDKTECGIHSIGLSGGVRQIEAEQ